MSEIRYPMSSEVELSITKEVELVSNLTVQILQQADTTFEQAVKDAYRILDLVVDEARKRIVEAGYDKKTIHLELYG